MILEVRVLRECPECRGSGRSGILSCPTCQGTGKVEAWASMQELSDQLLAGLTGGDEDEEG